MKKAELAAALGPPFMGTGAAYDYPSLITVSMGLTTIISPPKPVQPVPGPTNAAAAQTAALPTVAAK